ncbi:hypothetical protein GA0116948_105272 [Chitinophaga costaii]|uniref:Outer membrane protein beta-barrel domain-containing protein n=1 Tax=Chitinophaga costaii TaxID=1335309 RepID=A0A1C4DHH4_9BACT|nr:hypothetical protein [Chitinophaga costaii]PUZ24632.1 hypothetical protein DCM91_12120 [Chitinophaga costaii]SCC30680.1 hypothetical protein GA0116948_105272 [Chitinophaga costaii]
MKNRFKSGLAALASLLVFSLTTNAQTVDKKAATTDDKPKWIYSVGVDAGIPIGDFHDYYDWSLGGSLEANLAIIQRKLYVSLNAGYSNVFAKDDVVPGVKGQDLSLIPIKAGLRYYPFNTVSKLYVQGLAGVSILANKSDVGADKSAAFAYAPQIGYLFQLGKNHNYLDVAVKWEGTSKFADGDASEYNNLGLHVAYAFGSKK